MPQTKKPAGASPPTGQAPGNHPRKANIMLHAESHEVKLVEAQLAAIEDASSRVWAVARDDSGNKGNLLKAALDLVGAIAGAKVALAHLVSSAEMRGDLAHLDADEDVDFEAMIDAQYDAWRDAQDLRYDAESDFERPYVPGSVVLEAADYIPF